MGCCTNASGHAVYRFENKQHTISKKNASTLYRYGKGAAARNYTKKLKADLIKDIACK
jgi:hypothetical protein